MAIAPASFIAPRPHTPFTLDPRPRGGPKLPEDEEADKLSAEIAKTTGPTPTGAAAAPTAVPPPTGRQSAHPGPSGDPGRAAAIDMALGAKDERRALRGAAAAGREYDRKTQGGLVSGGLSGPSGTSDAAWRRMFPGAPAPAAAPFRGSTGPEVAAFQAGAPQVKTFANATGVTGRQVANLPAGQVATATVGTGNVAARTPYLGDETGNRTAQFVKPPASIAARSPIGPAVLPKGSAIPKGVGTAPGDEMMKKGRRIA